MQKQEYYLSLFEYDPETGKLRHKTNRTKWRIGELVGTMQGPYLVVKIDGVAVALHRVIWIMQTGAEPLNKIDHKNLNKIDNRWSNLREANSSQNGCNVAMKKSNTSGFKGVCFAKHANKWVAHCRINGRKTHLGYFNTAEKAAEAYKACVEKHHGEFGRVN